MDVFNNLKERFIKRLEEAKLRGEADEPIYHILDLINKLDNYFTTSSCAGRITLTSISKDRKKYNTKFLFKTHYTTDYISIWNVLLNEYDKHYSIWFKMEPFILHVAARTIEDANKMLKIAQQSGFKHSGIISISEYRIILEIQGVERIETIVAKRGNLLINEAYMKVLVDEANEKLILVRKRIDNFYKKLLENF